MSKNRRGRQKGMARSKLRYYNADIIHVGRKANPLVLRQYMRRALNAPHLQEPERKQIQVDYFPDKTPKETAPKAAIKEKLKLVRLDQDFYDGIDTYHRVRMSDPSIKTAEIHLFFHANHCFFIQNDLVKRRAFMSQDFNSRNRAIAVYRAGGLLWHQEVRIE
jgi:hypothetical protein